MARQEGHIGQEQSVALHETVLRYIKQFVKPCAKYRHEVQETFTEGCCYWFAYVL